jgi:formylglycine-generating enzyme required for sulfatase activity
MTRSQTLAYRCRFVLLVLGLGSFAAAVWLLFRHPGVEGDSLGMGVGGTPLLIPEVVLDRIGVGYHGYALFFLGLLLLAQWAFLRPRGKWAFRLTGKGRPMRSAVLAAAFMAMLLTVGLLAALLEIPNWWRNLARLYLGGTSAELAGPLVVLGVMVCLWVGWAAVFFVYWRQGDHFTQLERMTRGLIAGSCLELLIAAPVHVWASKRDDCYCTRGSYTGLVFGLTVLVWAFGPGLVLLFFREKYRREKLLTGLCPRCGDELVEPPDGPRFCPRCVKGDLGHAGPSHRAARRRGRLALLVGVLVLFAGLVGVATWAIKRIGPEKDWPPEIENSIGMKLVPIPPGTFTMGSPRGEAGRGSDEEQHEVEITQEFWLGVHEVTQRQFKEVMGYNPSYFSRDGKGKEGVTSDWKPAGGKEKVPADTGNFPVEHVSWEEAKEFCEKLSNRPEEKRGGRKYRLPSEAEWEYSCRGGAPSYQIFHLGNSLSSQQANFDSAHPFDSTPIPRNGGADKATPLHRTCKVGSYEKNRFGLYDMHGNVSEWCEDWYGWDYYGGSPRKDPPGPSDGDLRVFRGGSWLINRSNCRSAHRTRHPPGSRCHYLGFRVALVPSGRK